MNALLNVYKPDTETPYQIVKKVKSSLGISHTKVGYAGRLDPLASGVLILMVGDECKKRDQYQKNDKEYEFDLVLGIETDSQDPLGRTTKISRQDSILVEKIERVLQQFKGNLWQKIPLFCSYAINGTPMYKLARDGKISRSDRPTKKIYIKSIEVVSNRTIQLNAYSENCIERIERVKGYFRQKEIISEWKKSLREDQSFPIQIIKIRLTVSSGTYIRALAEEIGEKLGTVAIADNITRIRVGEFLIENSLKYD